MADKKISALTGASTPLAGTEVLPIVQGGATVKVAVSDLTAGRAVAMSSGATTGNFGVGIATPTMVTGGRVLHIDDQTAGSSPGIHLTNDVTTNLAGFGWTQFVGNAAGAGTKSLNFYSSMTTNPITFWNEGAEAVRIENQNIVIKVSGKGIDFSATPGTGTSELLADYEEGTFTPVVIGSTTAGTATYDFRIARYTKIGRMVQIEIAMQFNSGTGTGNLQISGLPFTNAANYSSLAIGRIDSLTLSALNIVTAYVEANADLINFRQYATGGGADSAVAYDAAALIFIAGCYSV
jgi:hypothetical protein